jgi:predicted ATP-grasp superfamily ATP-dependent carboligase
MSIRAERWGRAGRGDGRAPPGDRPRVLITEGDNVGVIAMVRGLARAGYDPWVAAAHRSAPVLRSRATGGGRIVPDPTASGSAFAKSIEELAGAIEPLAILPGGEKGMLALAELPASSPIRSRLALCDRQSVHRATDKAIISEIAEQAGLDVPESFVATADGAAQQRLPFGLPAVIKPLRTEVPSNGGFRTCGVRLASSREEAIAALRCLPGGRGLLQRYHQGRLCAIGGVFWNGEVVASVYQQAIRTWPTPCGQMAFAVALPHDAELVRRVTPLLRALAWEGLFQIQFIESGEGRLLIDLNPRVYGSLSLALGAGQNLPAIWVDLLRGESVAPAQYRSGVSFRNELLDAFALVSSVRGAKLKALARAAAVRASTYAFFESGDPMPLLALGPTAVVKLWARAKLPAAVRR